MGAPETPKGKLEQITKVNPRLCKLGLRLEAAEHAASPSCRENAAQQPEVADGISQRPRSYERHGG